MASARMKDKSHAHEILVKEELGIDAEEIKVDNLVTIIINYYDSYHSFIKGRTLSSK